MRIERETHESQRRSEGTRRAAPLARGFRRKADGYEIGRSGHVSIHARDRATTHGRAYASPVLDYPPEGGGFQPELVFDEKLNLPPLVCIMQTIRKTFSRKDHGLLSCVCI
jgi:hypothetical protein